MLCFVKWFTFCSFRCISSGIWLVSWSFAILTAFHRLFELHGLISLCILFFLSLYTVFLISFLILMTFSLSLFLPSLFHLATHFLFLLISLFIVELCSLLCIVPDFCSFSAASLSTILTSLFSNTLWHNIKGLACKTNLQCKAFLWGSTFLVEIPLLFSFQRV